MIYDGKAWVIDMMAGSLEELVGGELLRSFELLYHIIFLK